MNDTEIGELIKAFSAQVTTYSQRLAIVTDALEKKGENSNSDIIGLMLAKADADFAAYNVIMQLLLALNNRK